jgi:hypothetical protein
MFSRIIATVIAVSIALPAQTPAQPIPLTAGSFNQDVIADAGTSGATVGASFTADMDDGTIKAAGNYTWYAIGQNTSTPITGLPAGTAFSSPSNPTLIYQMQAANVPNALFLSSANPAITNGILTFATPSRFNSGYFSLLAASSHGTGSLTLALLLQGGGSVAIPGTISSPDWLTGSGGYFGDGRVDATGAYGPFVAGHPRVYDELVNVPVIALGQVVSGISVSWLGSSGNTTTAIFSVSGSNVTVPEPCSLALCGLSLFGAYALRLGRKTPG